LNELMVVAGEASGDMHAARVVKILKKELSQLRITGMGGSELSRLGQQQLVNKGDGSFGLGGALTSLPRHLRRAHLLLKRAEEGDVDLALLVDYSGFNMYLARQAQECAGGALYSAHGLVLGQMAGQMAGPAGGHSGRHLSPGAGSLPGSRG